MISKKDFFIFIKEVKKIKEKIKNNNSYSDLDFFQSILKLHKNLEFFDIKIRYNTEANFLEIFSKTPSIDRFFARRVDTIDRNTRKKIIFSIILKKKYSWLTWRQTGWLYHNQLEKFKINFKKEKTVFKKIKI